MLVVSASLVLTRTSDEEASAEVSELPRNSDSINDGKSSWRDESCSEVLLDVELDDGDGVAAGVVVLLTICRFTCLGK